MARQNLRVAGPDDAPPKPAKPKTILEAAESGSRRELLVALRRRIAKTINSEECPPRDLASLSRRLMEIESEINAIDAEAGEGNMGDAVETPDEQFDAEAL